jgi:hypothetical protein
MVGIPVSIRRVRMESEPSRQRFTPSRSMYMVGSYGSGGAWRKMSQSTRSPICFVVLIISVLMSLILMASKFQRFSRASTWNWDKSKYLRHGGISATQGVSNDIGE